MSMQSGGSGLPLYLQLPGINSQSRSRRRVLGSQHRGSNSKSVESANHEMPSPEEIDVLQKSTVGQLYDVIRDPPHEDYDQAPRVLVNVEGVKALPGSSLDVMTRNPKVVLLHVYNLNEQLVGANQALSGMSVGGAFHVGVEVFGSEWAYGVYGLCCDLPRSETAHVYKCSIYMGPTPLDQLQFARVVHELCHQWKGAEYDIVGHNCCSFASTFCQKLCVGVLPAWVDRFPRILHGGRKLGAQTITAGAQGAVAIGRGLSEAAEQIPEMAEKALPHIEQAAVTAGSISLQIASGVVQVSAPVAQAVAQVAAIHVQQGAQLLTARARASWHSITGSIFAAEQSPTHSLHSMDSLSPSPKSTTSVSPCHRFTGSRCGLPPENMSPIHSLNGARFGIPADSTGPVGHISSPACLPISSQQTRVGVERMRPLKQSVEAEILSCFDPSILAPKAPISRENGNVAPGIQNVEVEVVRTSGSLPMPAPPRSGYHQVVPTQVMSWNPTLVPAMQVPVGHNTGVPHAAPPAAPGHPGHFV
eukprot:gnl/MRDRNA2_/MRDRNA2_118107_c0_seq1.p1 gnl/MRDRNA2_/MRDRNA2_118107_c0~~gnl/MRDRNA2_/MRDRNA2_118107_c0_seq1.p1  ORF type:complete len:531 (+),score=55.88 gnl/MRDRNA2_/MRDRNA2_118107_c0_seq1:95-1687(+)